jgi:serine/threonine protein kinase/tetratricopeptide (TPR) repeat protein
MGVDKAASVEPGAIVGGRYRLLSEIGRGGMGTVWRAADVNEGRQIALKIIKPRGEDGRPGETAIGRFLREFRALDRLRSPHVVRVFEHASEGDVVYISMELLEGESLRDRLRAKGAVDAPTTLRVLTHVGRALSLAHQRGIVHRDLKPANIFMCHDDDGDIVSKVLDFGMAKSLSVPLATHDAVVTEIGRPLGTPYYMSPEQVRGMGNVDHRSDLWSIGVIAFECLCGRRPYMGKSMAKVFTEIVLGVPPVPSQVGEVPAGFDAWFARAVERDIQRRFQSAKVMLEELQEVIGEPITVTRQHTMVGVTLHDPTATTSLGTGLGDRTLRRAPTVHSTSFVGRDAELLQIDDAMRNHCRIVTLTGRLGSGRSRLAREWAQRREAVFRGGLWLCTLDHAATPEALWVRLAATLGVRLSEADPIDRVGRALGSMGRVLVLLQNVDDVRDVLAPALTRWLNAAPQAVFALTARRSLDVPTERVVRIEGLPLPPVGPITLEALARQPAAELFMRRATSFDPSLLGRSDQAGAIASLTRRVMGQPLALELLAAQTARSSPRDMMTALDMNLVRPGGTAIMHPDTIIASAYSWAQGQLAPQERAVLVQCACFRGGFTLAAAESVVDLSAFPDPAAVADVIARLVGLGWLRLNHAVLGETRFELPAAVLEMCGAQFDKGIGIGPSDDPSLAARVLERHVRYVAQLGSEEALEALLHRGGPMRRGRYIDEWHNAAIALERGASRHSGDPVAAIAMVCGAVEKLLGRNSSAARDLLRGVAAEGAGQSARLRCLAAQGEALARARRYDAALEVLTRACEQARQSGEARRLAIALRALGEVRLDVGQAEAAESCFEQSRQISIQHGDRHSASAALCGMAQVRVTLGQHASALEMLNEALLAFTELGARQLEAETRAEIGMALAELGKSVDSRTQLDHALTIHRELGNRYEEARLLGIMGEIAIRESRPNDAIALLEQAAGRSRELGARELEGRFLGAVGEVYLRRQNLERALRALSDGEQLLRAEGSPLEELAVLLCRRAQLELSHGQRDRARATLREVETIHPSLRGPAASRVARPLSALQRTLSLSSTRG